MPPSSSELISAFGHPLRRRILGAYLDGTVECASARDLAEALDERVGQVAYHLKSLAKGEILRPVEGREREQAQEAHCWALGVEAAWLRVILEVWVEVDMAG
jgi:DNA-binding transcriptional ArsR family regulator